MSALPGEVIHMLSDDGLDLHSVYDGPEGQVVVRMGWSDLDVAESNYESAINGFVTRLPAIIETVGEPGSGTRRTRLWRLSAFNVLINVGRPVWWLPRAQVSLAKRRVRVGWLLVAVTVEASNRNRAR